MADQPLRDQYDWAVLGDHPGALLSACLAARLGLSVLMLPIGNTHRVRTGRAGQCLDPETNFVSGLGRAGPNLGLWAECLTRLGALPAELEVVRQGVGLPQIVTPTARVTLFVENDRFRAELLRELGEEVERKSAWSQTIAAAEAEILRYWRELPDRLTLRPNSGKKAEKTVSLSTTAFRNKTLRQYRAEQNRPPVGPLGSGLVYGATSTTQESPKLGEVLQAVALARTGASVQGGQSGFRELLIRVAKRHGAHVATKSECKRIFIQGGRLVGVQASDSGSMITLNGAALGCGMDQVADQVSETGRAFFKRLKGPPAPTGWKFSIALTVHEEAIPPGTGQRLVWKEVGAPVIEMESLPPSDYGLREPGKKLLFLRTILPFNQESLSVAYQARVAARMVRKAMEILPFLEFHILRIFPDFRENEQELNEAYGFSVPQLIPSNLRCYSGEGMGAQTGIEGLFSVSPEAYPELGTLGGAVAGLEAVAWLAHRSGLPGPLV